MAHVEVADTLEIGMHFLSDGSRSSSQPEAVQSSPKSTPDDYHQQNGTAEISSPLTKHNSEGQSSNGSQIGGGSEQNGTAEIVKHKSKGMSITLDIPRGSNGNLGDVPELPYRDSDAPYIPPPSPATPETPHTSIGCSDAELLRQQNAREKWVNVAKPLMRLKTLVLALSPFILHFKQRRYPWIQLAGHQGNFTPGSESGTIVKKSNIIERHALTALMSSELRPFVPELLGIVEKDGVVYMEMVDLLREFREPAVMDIKIGVRTYLEDELAKEKTRRVSRSDLYRKMVSVDRDEPTEDEHAEKGVTKPRYMQWRETLSSTSTLGFRIEGIRTPGGKSFKGFKQTREREEVIGELRSYLSNYSDLKEPFLQKMTEIRSVLETSEFFRTHEVIGSSLLFLYDSSSKCDIHMIDYGKTIELPPGISVDHRSPWMEGNHEDGYLWGLDNLIGLWKEL